MGNLTERQNAQVTDLKESIVLDKEFQSYIDMCDKILSRDSEENKSNENTVGVPPPVTPGAQVPNRVPQVPQAQQGNANNANVMNTLKQMKDKMKRGQDVRDDLNNLLNTIQ